MTHGPTNGIATEKKKIRLSGVIAMTISHRYNAVSGRSDISTYGSN